MTERGRHARVGDIVGGNIDRLHRGDGAVLRRNDAFLQLAHFGAERRLVAHGRRQATQERRNFGASKHVAEDVVDKEEHVLFFMVPEIFGLGEAGERNAETRSRRLVHLAEDQHGFIDDLGFRHIEVEVVSLAGALAHAGKHRHAAVMLRHVMDELHDDHGLAHAGAAEETDLAALLERREEVDDLDAGFEHLRPGLLIEESRRIAMNGQGGFGLDLALVIDGPSGIVHEPSQACLADRHRNRCAGIDHRKPAGHALGWAENDRARGVGAHVLHHFENHRRVQLSGAAGSLIDRQCGIDGRNFVRREFDVDDLTENLGNFTCSHYFTTSLVAMISAISLVINAWRALFISRVMVSMSVPALRVALSMARMRAASSAV